jgi:hypothetical protein
MSDNHAESAGILTFGRLCLPGRSRAKFTTTADDLVPAILVPAILAPAILAPAILAPAILFR